MLGAIFLEFAVFLHAVVALMHELIVRRAVCPRQMRRGGECANGRRNGIRALLLWKADHLRKLRSDHIKVLGRDPHAILRRIDIGKKPQDAISIRRTRRERIDVRQIVARA